MKTFAKVVSLVALAAVIVPCLLFFGGVIGHEPVKLAAFIGSIVWFMATPFWMGRQLPIDAQEVEI